VNLAIASLLGAVYVLAAVAVVLYAIPQFWGQTFGDRFKFLDYDLGRMAVQLAVFAGLVWFGRVLLGDHAPRGVRGGVFLILVWAALIFFVWRWLALTVEGGAGMIVAGVFAAFLLFLAVRFFTGRTGEAWMVGLEEQGWFSTALYKRSLGIRARRLTILGFLILGGSGVWVLGRGGSLPPEWNLTMPFEGLASVTVLPSADYTVPILLAALTLWVGWRAVNVPTFAEFLIATEAEMNKVSWTPKRRLAQDTVVVLTTTLILALFLLLVDLFWGWLLSRSIVGVLPSKGTGPDKSGKVERVRW
jgi:preprotein translocase SecE subunit